MKQQCISVFIMSSGLFGTLLSLTDCVPLFSNTGWAQESYLAYLEKHIETILDEYCQPYFANPGRVDI